MQALINVKIYDYEKFIENGYVIFADKIIEVGSMEDFQGCEVINNGKGKLLLPNLVNGHTHAYSTLFRGAPLEANPQDFKEVLDQIWWKFDRQLNKESIMESARAYAELSLLHGVSAIIDHHASGLIEDSLYYMERVFNKLGLKHMLCFETSDRFDIEACIRENLRVSEHIKHFGLHASMSLSDETLERVSAINDLPIHIHLAESQLDEEDAVDKYHLLALERLNEFGLLRKDSLLAHGIHISDVEARIIKERECTLAVNPTSNLNNGVGMYPYELIQKYGIPVIVGTDGLGGNIAKEYQQLYFVGNQTLKKSGGVDMDWVKKTLINSYRYFNRLSGSKIGKIDKDYDSDFMLVDYHEITPMHEANAFGHILFGVFEALRPYAVYVHGIKLVDQFRLVNSHDRDDQAIDELWRKICD